VNLPRLVSGKSAFNLEKQEQWARIAAQRGLHTDELAQQVASHCREDDTRFIEAVNLGRAAAERGDFVEQQEVGKRLKPILRP
jgi:hypothetical protein